MKTHFYNRGFTILIAMVLTATLLLVATTVASLAVRESFIAVSSSNSQYAFYAADTGIECALYWDVKNPGGSAFATSTNATVIQCNQDLNNLRNPNPDVVGGSAVSTFRLTFLPDPYCADVTVTKNPDNTTKIESTGYNTCSATDPRRVARSVRVTY